MRKESLKKDGTKNGMADDQETDATTHESAVNVEPIGSVNGNGTAAAASVAGSHDPLDIEERTSNVGSVKNAPVLKRNNKTKAAKKAMEPEPQRPATKDGADAIDDADGDYEVEDIVQHKIAGKRVLFLVRWKNFGPSGDTWEPESSLACPDIVARYREANPNLAPAGGGASKRKAASSATADKGGRKKRKLLVGEPADEEQEDEYEVEEIVGHKVERKKNVFLIRWKGYGADADTWEKEDVLSCPEIVAKYKKEHEGELTAATAAPNKKATKAEKALKEYEVQRIVDTKKVKGEVYYLIRWKNSRPSSDSWERESQLSCSELIAKFKEQQSKRVVSPKREAKRHANYSDDVVEESEDEIIPHKKQRGIKPAKEVREDYEVEKIVDQKTEKGQKWFLVKWKDYPSSQNTWQLKSTLACPELLKKFAAQTPVKGKPSKSVVAARKSVAAPQSARKLAATPKGKGKARELAKIAPAVSAQKKKSSKSATKKPAVEEEPDWEVEQITDVKFDEDESRTFLIRWKGCDASQDTWEPESNLSCPALIDKFMKSGGDPAKRKKKSSRK